MQAGDEVDFLVKVIFLGDAAVGKTCLIEKLFSDQFSLQTQPTIGCDFRQKNYEVDGKRVGVSLWDTAGAERFSAMTPSYFRGAHGVVLVFDVTRRETFTALENKWLSDVQEYASSPDVIKLILGNKTDLSEKRQVSPEEGAELARRHGCLYKETSAAARDENVHDALVWGLLTNILANESLLKQYNHEKLNIEQIVVEEPRRHPCCWM